MEEERVFAKAEEETRRARKLLEAAERKVQEAEERKVSLRAQLETGVASVEDPAKDIGELLVEGSCTSGAQKEGD